MFVISGYVWTQITEGEQVCTSWSASGACLESGNKFITIYLIPIITAGLVGLFPLLSRFESRPANVLASHKALATMGTTMLLFVLVFHTILMREIMGHTGGIGTYWPILAGLVTVVLGNYLGKIQQNDFIGIRTPWTMASEQSWNKTHRLGGRLMVLLGILFMAGTIVFEGDGWFYFLLGGALLLVVVVTVYSYIIWKNDADVRPV
jgi:uncharacterized membrane protein